MSTGQSDRHNQICACQNLCRSMTVTGRLFPGLMVRIFSFGERWNVPFNSAVASLNGTFHQQRISLLTTLRTLQMYSTVIFCRSLTLPNATIHIVTSTKRTIIPLTHFRISLLRLRNRAMFTQLGARWHFLRAGPQILPSL